MAIAGSAWRPKLTRRFREGEWCECWNDSASCADSGHRQRARIRQPGARCRGLRTRRQVTFHPTGQADSKRFHRELRRQDARRMLERTWFRTLNGARQTIEAWRRDYNEVRPTAHWLTGPRKSSQRAREKNKGKRRPRNSHYDFHETAAA